MNTRQTKKKKNRNNKEKRKRKTKLNTRGMNNVTVTYIRMTNKLVKQLERFRQYHVNVINPKVVTQR